MRRSKIHKSKPEPKNRIVNTVYFIYQARGNTRISHAEFVYDEQAHNNVCLCLIELPA